MGDLDVGDQYMHMTGTIKKLTKLATTMHIYTITDVAWRTLTRRTSTNTVWRRMKGTIRVK